MSLRYNYQKRIKKLRQIELTIESLRNVSFSDLCLLADDLFARFVKLKALKPDGIHVDCVTCHREIVIVESQLGHFVDRDVKILRRDERNVDVQCEDCNIFKRGNIPAFERHLGPELVRELRGIEATVKVYKEERWQVTDFIIQTTPLIYELENKLHQDLEFWKLQRIRS